MSASLHDVRTTPISDEKFVASDPSQAATYWQARALRAEAKLAEFDATLDYGEALAQAREDGLT